MGEHEGGSALASSLVILFILLGLVTGLSTLFVNEVNISSYEVNLTRAFYIAEAGIAYASTVLGANDKWDSDNGELNNTVINRINSSLKEGKLSSVIRSVDMTTGYITLVSTGICNGLEKKIKAVYDFSYSEGGAFNHSLVSRGAMDLYDNSIITGDESGGDIYSNSGVFPHDKFILADSVVKEYQSKLIFPWIDLDVIRNDPNKNTDINNIGGNVTHITGDITLAEQSPLVVNSGGILLVDGDLNVHDQLLFNSSESFILIVTGDILINDIGEGNSLIFAKGDIQINDVQNFNGCIIAGGYEEDEADLYMEAAGTLVFNDAIDISFDNSFIDLFVKYGILVRGSDGESLFRYRLISWSEQY